VAIFAGNTFRNVILISNECGDVRRRSVADGAPGTFRWIWDVESFGEASGTGSNESGVSAGMKIEFTPAGVLVTLIASTPVACGRTASLWSLEQRI
jgi:hypothetical protein